MARATWLSIAHQRTAADAVAQLEAGARSDSVVTGGHGVQACAIRRRCAEAAEPDGCGWHPLKVVASMDQKRLEAAPAAGRARLRASPAEVVVDVVPVERGGGGER